MLAITIGTYALETKKVAILEPVDHEGKLTYGQKLMLRSNLAKAVTNTTGFEAYDRSDVDAIMGEQDFQRTGLVSDDEIQKLGQMTGVSYILVSEGALAGDNYIFVSVKLLNVETGKVEMTDNAMMGMSATQMQEGCENLASALLSKKKNSKKQIVVNPLLTAQTQSQSQAPVQKPVQQQVPTKTATKQTSSPTQTGLVTRYSAKEYTYMGIKMNAGGYENLLRQNCPAAYKQFNTGKKLTGAGWGCFAGGLFGIVVGAPLMAVGGEEGGDDGLIGAGAAFVSIGSIALAGSIPLLVVGSVMKKKSVNTYNQQCVKSMNTPVLLSLCAGKNGLGIAFQF